MKKVHSILSICACFGLLACAPTEGDADNIEEQGRNRAPKPQVCATAPTVGVSEVGVMHNLLLRDMLDYLDDAFDLDEQTELTDEIVDAATNRIKTLMCTGHVDCSGVEAVMTDFGSITKEKRRSPVRGVSLARAVRDQVKTLPGVTPEDAWVDAALAAIDAAATDPAKSEAEVIGVINEQGLGKGCFDGGNQGRIFRSVALGSYGFWARELLEKPDHYQDHEVFSWLIADASGAMAGGAMGGPAGAAGGAALMSGATYLSDRFDL